MEKKVVLITGATGGIGSSLAEIFAKNNYNVIINYNNNETSAINLKNKLEKEYKIECLCIKANVSNETEVTNMFNKIIDKYNRIDVVINNAGITNDSPVEVKTKETFMNILETNLYGVFLISKIFGKYMSENNGGNIVNISSTNAIDSYYTFSIYPSRAYTINSYIWTINISKIVC